MSNGERTSETMLEHALALAARGWPVFPCDPRSKQPLLKATAEERKEARGGLKKATTSPEVIAGWWKRWPKAMIGVPTGEPIGAFVIDIDAGTDKDTGEIHEYGTLLRNLCEAIGDRLPRTVIAETPRGGRHHFFAMPIGEKIGNRAGLVGKDSRIDVRGTGGYVIVPPSVKDDGKSYGWLVAPTDRGFAAPPEALLDCVLRRGRWGKGVESTDSSRPDPAPGAKPGAAAADVDQAVRKYALAALEAEKRNVAEAREGTRNDALNVAALKLYELEAAGVLSEREILAALEDAAEASGLARDDGWPSVRATIASGARKGRTQPRPLEEIRRKAQERAARGPYRKTAGARLRAGPHDPAAGGEPSEGSSSPSSPAPPHGDDGDPSLASVAAETGGDPPKTPEEIDAMFRDCAELDHSDTDNGKRLIRYLGDDILVMAQSGITGGAYLTWSGTHWDLDGGAAGAMRLGQQVGAYIDREADYMAAFESEKKAIEAAAAAKKELDASALHADERRFELEVTIGAGKSARQALSKRKQARRKFAVASKNKGRIEAMLACAAAHLRRSPDVFNFDPLKVATATHTLTFTRVRDPECPDPDVERWRYACVPVKGHRRDDLITAIVPVPYQPEHKGERWLAFVKRFLPQDPKRRTVQQFCGLGLTGLPIQKVMFHHGSGGNGKSVFLETLTRVLGDSFAVGLPAESISGRSERGAGQAAPDIERLFGKRMLRVLELKAGEPLQQEMIKRLTGGEKIPVRTLFKGYYEFQPIAKPHMSGNDFPTFDGSDGGMKRRLLTVHWTEQIPEAEQRNIEDVVRELVAEGPAILNWLIEGALDYLNNGLVISDDIRAYTQAYIDEMDPVGQFARAHVSPAPGEFVAARAMFNAYQAWSEANGRKAFQEARFGRLMKKVVTRDDSGRIHRYVDVRLHDVPERPGSDPPPHTRAPEGARDTSNLTS